MRLADEYKAGKEELETILDFLPSALDQDTKDDLEDEVAMISARLAVMRMTDAALEAEAADPSDGTKESRYGARVVEFEIERRAGLSAEHRTRETFERARLLRSLGVSYHQQIEGDAALRKAAPERGE